MGRLTQFSTLAALLGQRSTPLLVRAASVLTVSIVFVGCTRHALDTEYAGPRTLPPELRAPFLAHGERSVELISETLLRKAHSYHVHRYELKPGISLFDDQTLRIDLFEHVDHDEPQPLVLVLPILGGGYSIANHFASRFARSGFIAAIVHRQDKYKNMADDAEELNRIFEQIVIDHQQAIDWLINHPRVDAERIGIFGISAGSIQGGLVYAIDDRVKTAVLALTGSDLPYILAHSKEGGIARRRDQLLEEHNLTADELVDILRAEFKHDPLVYAPYMDARHVLLILASFDQVVPYRTGQMLREAMGGPATIVVPSGHYTAILFVPFLEQATVNFLRRQLRKRSDLSRQAPGGTIFQSPGTEHRSAIINFAEMALTLPRMQVSVR